MTWDWILPAIGGAIVTAIVGGGESRIRSWWSRRGCIGIRIGHRGAPSYVTRGRWDADTQRLVQDAPRFMNFSVPITVTNGTDAELTLHVGSAHFSEGEPVMNKDGSRLFPGAGLHQVGIEVRNVAGEAMGPIRVPARSIEHFVVAGTVTSPVCHGGPYLSWKYLFIDWLSEPHAVRPLVMRVDGGFSGGREYKAELEPLFPIPEHYIGMQGSLGLTQTPRDWSVANVLPVTPRRD